MQILKTKEGIEVGSRVLYCLSAQDVEAVHRRRVEPGDIHARIEAGNWPIGAQAHTGERVTEGQYLPLDVVYLGPEEKNGSTWISGRVLLPGNDILWVGNVSYGSDAGQWTTVPEILAKAESLDSDTPKEEENLEIQFD